jgi:hypothetical protein
MSPLRIMSTSFLAIGRLLIGALLFAETTAGAVFASSVDQLTDLTGKAVVTVTLTGRDNFNSEYRYDLTVRNRSSDPFIADSLIVVLEKITNLAGEDREPLKSEPLIHRFEVIGQDGETEDGKPLSAFEIRIMFRSLLPPFESMGKSVFLPSPRPPTTSLKAAALLKTGRIASSNCC